MLGMRLCTLHNLYFYNKMMVNVRASIRNGCFEEFKKDMLDSMRNGGKEEEN